MTLKLSAIVRARMASKSSLPSYSQLSATPLVRVRWAIKALLSLRRERGRFPALAVILIILTTLWFAIFAVNAKIPPLQLEEYGPYIGTASVVVLLGMIFFYLVAFRFYEDSFYLFLSIGWYANLVYIFFETFFPKSFSDFNYSLQVGALGVFTSIPFYLAAFIRAGRAINYRRLLFESFGWLIWFVVTLTISIGLIYGDWKDKPSQQKFLILLAPTIPFSIYILFRVGYALRERLSDNPHGIWRRIFPWTFYLYALLQPLYLLKLKRGALPVIMGAFIAALLIKAINSVAALFVIYRSASFEKRSHRNVQEMFMEAKSEFNEAQVRLRERSALEDIGLLTASIEHDIRNPLTVIGTELETLKKKLQAQPDAISHLEYIEEQKQRIFDATTIVPLLRGSNAFFEKLMQKVTLNDLINAAIKDVKREMNPTNMYFKVNREQKVIKNYFVRAYGPLLEQAIVNVLRNSVEAIREARRDSGLIDIEISEHSGLDNLIEVNIEDNGCGIPEQVLPLVKSVFTTRDDRKPNSGLGLFISNRILEVHGGGLEIRSTYGVGTVVTLLIPKWRDARHLT